MNDDILAALNRERYGPSLWWKRDNPSRELADDVPKFDDSELACGRRRRALAADYDRAKEASA